MPHIQGIKEYSEHEIAEFRSDVLAGNSTNQLKNIYPHDMIIRYYMRFRRQMRNDKKV